jgi:hypothetical protein
MSEMADILFHQIHRTLMEYKKNILKNMQSTIRNT